MDPTPTPTSTSPTPTTVNIQASLGAIYLTFAGFIGILGAMALLYAGYLWMFSGHSSQGSDKSRTAAWCAIVGMILCLFSYTLSVLITGDIK